MAVSHNNLSVMLKRTNILSNSFRSCSNTRVKKGLVLGVYSQKTTKTIQLTKGAQRYNECCNGKLVDSIKNAADDYIKPKLSYVFWNLCDTYRSVAVVGIDEDTCYNEDEELDERREAVRDAAHYGCSSLQAVGMNEIDLDEMDDSMAAAEGAKLSTFVFDEFRSVKKPRVDVNLYHGDEQRWREGLIKADAQNFARVLSDIPSNKKPPTEFAKIVCEALEPFNVEVKVRDRKWMEAKKMGGLLSVTSGSEQPPIFLEIHYKGTSSEERSVALVGKGVTFDSGGISLKPPAKMDEMRGDCGGAATVIASIKAAAQLKLPINIVGLTPLCENLINGRATKPGDVITMMNGKTVCVDNTDAEGRLILGDALTYSGNFNPKFVLDIATLTGAMRVSLGGGATGAFSNNTPLFEKLRRAGSVSGDRMWRLPLWKYYSEQMTDFKVYDINNVSRGKGGGSCTAAGFLRQFVPEQLPWMHLDIAGVSDSSSHPAGKTYVGNNFNGRPTRTLIYFLQSLSQK